MRKTKDVLSPVRKTISTAISRHIYHGTGNRKVADRYGCWVWLRHDIHMRLHNLDKELDRRLQEICQEKFEETHTREEFRRLFGKSYL